MNMLKKSENMQSKMILLTLDELVPENSLYRKIDKYIDFSLRQISDHNHPTSC